MELKLIFNFYTLKFYNSINGVQSMGSNYSKKNNEETHYMYIYPDQKWKLKIHNDIDIVIPHLNGKKYLIQKKYIK